MIVSVSLVLEKKKTGWFGEESNGTDTVDGIIQKLTIQ
jgi:hypothetical protein